MDGRILFLKKRMLSDLSLTWSVEQMAEMVDISASHLQQLFKLHIGMTPIQYLRHPRLETARELLENSFNRIKVTGAKVGMHDQSHFIRDFKDKYGMTPNEYRRRHWVKINLLEK